MNRECKQLNNSVVSYHSHLLTRVDSEESLRKKLIEEVKSYTLGFKDVEIALIKNGHFTQGTIITFTDEEDNKVYVLICELLGVFISDIMEYPY